MKVGLILLGLEEGWYWEGGEKASSDGEDAPGWKCSRVLLKFSYMAGLNSVRDVCSIGKWGLFYNHFSSHDTHRVKGWHLNRSSTAPERHPLESWSPGRDTSEKSSQQQRGFVASAWDVQILSSRSQRPWHCNGSHKALCVLWEARIWEQWEVSSELGTVPGMELDSPILVPELKQLGSGRASLVLFMELLFGFWSFMQHLLTVPNSCTGLLRSWETKTAIQGALTLCSAVGSK